MSVSVTHNETAVDNLCVTKVLLMESLVWNLNCGFYAKCLEFNMLQVTEMQTPHMPHTLT